MGQWLYATTTVLTHTLKASTSGLSRWSNPALAQTPCGGLSVRVRTPGTIGSPCTWRTIAVVEARRETGRIRVRIGVDIGGTFTDVVVFDEEQHSVALAKVLTTPAALAQGVQEGIAKAALPLGAVSLLIHGSTIVVNAILDRRGAKTAHVTTQGFHDVYEIGRIN